MDDLVGDRRQRIATERFPPRETFIETDAEGEDVGAAVDRCSANLFGRHVVGRSEKLSGGREVSAGRDLFVGEMAQGRRTGSKKVSEHAQFAIGRLAPDNLP